ncbi:MAG TPA: serine/threonine-protein kinase [Minicystis sp.]|nr:serine/threonine-protein kinase [Minicystis sp.]
MFCPRCHRGYDESHLYCPSDGERLLESLNVASFPAKPTREQGAVLGERYEVRGFIGKGAMARVYLAEDLVTHGPVALKVLEPIHAKHDATRERFLREAQAATRIGHPNIVRVLDAGVRGDGAPYLVMEFLFGESLGDWLRREGVMPLEVGLPVAAQIADALAAAHAVDSVHRDVKPDNVFLVGEPGAPYAVKIVDFGFAKLRGETTFSQVGVAIGTLEYMAPEQAVSDTPDAHTDVYGLGVVLYRMFTGVLPWPDVEDADLLARQLAAPPPPPSAAEPSIDPRIEAVILKAMKKHPRNRYASMDDLLEDLERIGGRRDGELSAYAPPAVEPDVYEPEGPFSRTAARYLYKRIGLVPPAW